MTIPRRSWRAAGTLAAAAVVGLSGVVLTAGPAAAHTPTWDVTCDAVSLHLTQYNARVTNEVTVTVDGKDLLPTEKFGTDFEKTLALPKHDQPLEVHLVVKAGDGERYSKKDSRTAPVCEESTPPSTSTPTPTPSVTKPSETPTTASPSPSDTPSESASPSAPAAATPSPSSPDLAETGSSSATPIIGGAAVAVLLAGGGIMWSVRKRRTAQH